TFEHPSRVVPDCKAIDQEDRCRFSNRISILSLARPCSAAQSLLWRPFTEPHVTLARRPLRCLVNRSEAHFVDRRGAVRRSLCSLSDHGYQGPQARSEASSRTRLAAFPGRAFGRPGSTLSCRTAPHGTHVGCTMNMYDGGLPDLPGRPRKRIGGRP